MGYRSEGMLVISKKELENKKATDSGLPAALDDMSQGEFNNEYMSYVFSGWKMYETYPDVVEFYAWLDELDCHADDEAYAYIELGEEIDDVTERGTTELINVVRTIETY